MRPGTDPLDPGLSGGRSIPGGGGGIGPFIAPEKAAS